MDENRDNKLAKQNVNRGDQEVVLKPDKDHSSKSRTRQAYESLATFHDDSGDDLVAALRSYFLTHTFDPLTGEIYTVH